MYIKEEEKKRILKVVTEENCFSYQDDEYPGFTYFPVYFDIVSESGDPDKDEDYSKYSDMVDKLLKEIDPDLYTPGYNGYEDAFEVSRLSFWGNGKKDSQK